jgi:hypothetical protein
LISWIRTHPEIRKNFGSPPDFLFRRGFWGVTATLRTAAVRGGGSPSSALTVVAIVGLLSAVLRVDMSVAEEFLGDDEFDALFREQAAECRGRGSGCGGVW